ncbi:hypothetical protein ABH902_001002 [Enterococcus sp. UD-01]
MITELLDHLNNNLLIAHYCGFDIARPYLLTGHSTDS